MATAIKCRPADFLDTARNVDSAQLGAIIKSRRADCCHTVGDIDARELRVGKSIPSNCFHAIGNDERARACSRAAQQHLSRVVIEHSVLVGVITAAVLNSDFFQFLHRTQVVVHNLGRSGQVEQDERRFIECCSAQRHQSSRQVHTLQASFLKGFVADFGEGARQGDGF